MPIREEVPKSPGRQVVSAQSLKELATLAFEAGALAVGQSGAAVKEPRSVPLQSYPMLGRASNLVRATTEGDFGPIEVFGEQTPWPGSKQVHGELQFPGIGGNFLSTPDLNLLDADTAHLQQSIGLWLAASPGLETPDLAAILTPEYGNTHGRAITTDTVKPVLRGGNGPTGTGIVVSPSTQYTMTVAVAASVAADARIWLREYEGTTDLGNSLFSDWAALTVGSWTILTLTVTTRATTDNAEFRIGYRGDGDVNLSIGDYLYWDAVCIQAGSDPTFYPSLRIVGTLEHETDLALDLWGTGSTQSVMRQGVGAENGYQYVSNIVALQNITYGDGDTNRFNGSDQFTLVDGEFSRNKFVARLDGSITYYQNGVEVDTDAMTAAAGSPASSPLFLGSNHAGTENIAGKMKWFILRDGEGPSAPIVAAFDAFDLYGLNIYEGQTFVDGVTGRTWTVHGDNWPASIDVVEDDLTDIYGGFDDYDAAVELNGVDQFVQTKNINLADADVAHNYQQLGWGNFSGLSSATRVASVPSWSGFAVAMEASGAGSGQGGVLPANYIAATATTVYSFSFGSEALAGYEARALLQWRDAGLASLGVSGGSWTEIVGGRIVVDGKAAPANTAWARPLIYFRKLDDSNPDPGTTLLAFDFMVEEAVTASPTFMPSFNFVSAVDIRMSWVDGDPGGSGTSLAGVFSGSAASRVWQFRRGGANYWNWDVGDGSSTLWGSNNDFAAIADQRLYLKAIWDGVNRLTYTSDDPDDYGVAISQALAITPVANPSGLPLVIGASYAGTGENPGRYFDFEMRDGEDGPVVLSFNSKNMKEVGDLPSGFSHMGEDGRLWTFPNGATMKWTPKLVAGP